MLADLQESPGHSPGQAALGDPLEQRAGTKRCPERPSHHSRAVIPCDSVCDIGFSAASAMPILTSVSRCCISVNLCLS